MLRLRDHIISLVAVFLALALGILIGTGFSEDMLVTQQRLLIDRLMLEFSDLRAEQHRLEAQIQEQKRDLNLWEQYREALYDMQVPGSLAGRKLALVCHAAELPETVLTLLADAGAEPVAVLRVAEKRAGGQAAAGLGRAVCSLLAAGEAEGQAQMLQELQQDGRLSPELLLPERADTMLLFLGEKERVDTVFVQELAAAAADCGLPLVGLENSGVKKSALETVKAAGMSTIDNAETVFGQFSLLAVLQGVPGNYGIKAGADAFLPVFREVP
ncbi:MAG TPA: copper transporter [Firmicutes bacterium]|nr:copper transporter [Bacillota bacterium]